MKAHTKFALMLLLLGVLGIFVGKTVLTRMQDQQFFDFTDAGANKGKISIGVDNWIGYFPLCSPVMQRRMYQQGYLLECVEDQANYAERMQALANEELDLAVATVDSYLLNGIKTNYPGTIIAVLDESKGGDALLAWKDQVTTLDHLGKKDTAIKIAFTPDSPSDHLLKTVAVHFDIAHLKRRQQWPVYTNGSEDALQRLLSKQVAAAVLWEPDVSKALQQPGVHVLLSTEQTRQLIVDVLMAGKKIIRERPEFMNILLSEYFQALKYYRDNHDELVDDVKKATKLNDQSITSLLKGVQWQTLTDNANKWFGTVTINGVPEQELVETIKSSINIFMDYGSMSASPLPANDPYRIISSHFIDQVNQQLGVISDVVTAEEHSFKAINEQQWENLQQVGKLKIRPVIFSSGTDSLTLDDKNELDVAADTLKHYPDFRILVRGHTSTRGDKRLNKTLSQDRADAVARYLRITHDITTQRMKAIGYGGDKPLKRLAGENNRAYNYRLPRVELVLVTDKF